MQSCLGGAVLSEEALFALADQLIQSSFDAGAKVAKRGRVDDYAVILLEGAAEYKRKDQRVKLAPPALIGSLALLREPSPVSVTAISPLRVALLSAHAFAELQKSYAELRQAATSIVVEQLELGPDAVADSLEGFAPVAYRGAGRSAHVFKASNKRTGRQVALKMLNHETSDDAADVLRSGLNAAQALRHPNICTMHTWFEAFDTLFVASQWCEGESLGELIRRCHPLPQRVIKQVIGSVVQALHYAHVNSVVHQDVKPSNIFIVDGGRIKLADFGVAAPIGRREESDKRRVVGTLAYMAPEQLAGDDVDGKADWFQLGCVLFEMLTGRMPFSRTDRLSLFSEKVMFKLPEKDEIRPGLGESLYVLLGQWLKSKASARQFDRKKVSSWASPIDEAALRG